VASAIWRATLITVVVAGCLLGGSGAAAVIRPGQPPDCDEHLATKQITALFSALSAGDTARVARLFPNDRTWSFSSGPGGEVVSSGGGIRITPEPAVASRLSDAVQRGDTRAIIRLFPQAGGWQLDVSPTLDGFFAHGRFSDTQVGASRPGRLGRVVAQFEGMKLRSVTPVGGKAQATDYHAVIADEYFPDATMRWRATGGRLKEQRIRAIDIGAKIVIYCETGLFARVALGLHRANEPF
jgi:hypothetical protein